MYMHSVPFHTLSICTVGLYRLNTMSEHPVHLGSGVTNYRETLLHIYAHMLKLSSSYISLSAVSQINMMDYGLDCRGSGIVGLEFPHATKRQTELKTPASLQPVYLTFSPRPLQASEHILLLESRS